MSEEIFDVIVVGGGPAGLSAALVLGRCRRKVLVVDEGKPRNAASRALHGYLSRDGMAPADFLQVSRQQLERYECVRQIRGRIEAIEPFDGRFAAIDRDGVRLVGRMVLLATGLVDQLPEIDGIHECYGISIHPCPLCDGWEHRDEPLAVIGGDAAAAGLAEELLLWSDDVVMCTNGPHGLDRSKLEKLAALGIRVEVQPIRRLEGDHGHLRQIVFSDGSMMGRRGAFLFPGQVQRSDFAERLGCKMSQEEPVVECALNGGTSVPGVYVVGNSSGGVQMILAAAAEGMEAALAINNALLEADHRARRRNHSGHRR
jgi:thioredoxin reductase